MEYAGSVTFPLPDGAIAFSCEYVIAPSPNDLETTYIMGLAQGGFDPD
jgi:hypothetical protein